MFVLTVSLFGCVWATPTLLPVLLGSTTVAMLVAVCYALIHFLVNFALVVLLSHFDSSICV